MDGATIDFIVIPIVAIISLAAWLVPIYWADSHPRKSPRTTTVTGPRDAVADQAGTAYTGTAHAGTAHAGTAHAGTAHAGTAHAGTGHAVAGQGNVPRQATAPAGDHDPVPARRQSSSKPYR
jgi:hypothetical protein